jgi:hypothetical protein
VFVLFEDYPETQSRAGVKGGFSCHPQKAFGRGFRAVDNPQHG